MSTYATLFPDKVDKFVIDSSGPTYPNLFDMAAEKGVGIDFRMNYIVYSCSARRMFDKNDERSCPVDDMRKVSLFRKVH